MRLVPAIGGEEDRYVELEGEPELIVSDRPIQKDTQSFPRLSLRPVSAKLLSSLTHAVPSRSFRFSGTAHVPLSRADKLRQRSLSVQQRVRMIVRY